MGTLSKHSGGRKDADCGQRLAVGYVRVSTEMQAADGLSLDAQTAAIEQYCSMQGLRLVEIHRDVLSGGKSERPGLQAFQIYKTSGYRRSVGIPDVAEA